jgi:hypothetical protein
LDDLVADNCLKLFTDYKLDIRAREPGEALEVERFLLCGVIGFTAKHMRGALVLATSREPLDRTRPNAGPSHRDWICELANQLLGRVKNQMLSRAVEIFPSTPIALRGEHLSPVLEQSLVAELFTTERGAVCVWMECEFDEGFEIADPTPCEVPPIAEGGAIFF